MTTPSLDDAVRRNREALSRFVTAVEGLSADEWRTPVAPGKWSPAQIAEHLALTADEARQVLRGTSSLPRLPAPVRPLVRWIVLRSVRTGKFPRGGKAAKAFTPSGASAERAQALQRLRTSADAFEAEFAAAARAGRTKLAHPAFGALDLVAYMLFNALHVRHHTAHIPARVP